MWPADKPIGASRWIINHTGYGGRPYDMGLRLYFFRDLPKCKTDPRFVMHPDFQAWIKGPK